MHYIVRSFSESFLWPIKLAPPVCTLLLYPALPLGTNSCPAGETCCLLPTNQIAAATLAILLFPCNLCCFRCCFRGSFLCRMMLLSSSFAPAACFSCPFLDITWQKFYHTSSFFGQERFTESREIWPIQMAYNFFAFVTSHVSYHWQLNINNKNWNYIIGES